MESESLLQKKTEYWKKRLIDLSKRNNLVSYRFTKAKSIKIIHPTIEQILADLYEEKNILFSKEESKSKVVNWGCSDIDDITDKKLTALYRQTRENFQELGINTCFVSLYMLRYKENEQQEDFNLAPLFLFPVSLERLPRTSKFEHRFEIVSGAEDLHVNPALIEKLDNDFKLKMPEFNGDIELFISELKKIISGNETWSIVEDCFLDIFSYQKYIMFKDLEDNKELILESDLMKGFVGDKNALQDEIAESQRDKFNLDVDGIDILSADSSQKKAIELAKAGVTFVLQGPPGTGKSQTIANMIATLMKEKKKVLFVSQKMAALNVVEKRLDEVGLGRYALNLHNYKGNKKEVIQQLINELETSPFISEKVRRYTFNSYLDNQYKINQYYNLLCEKHKPRNYSIYEIRGELSKLFEVNLLESNLSDTLNYNDKTFSENINILENIDKICENIDNPLNSIYFYYDRSKNSTVEKTKLKQTIENLKSLQLAINEHRNDIKNKIDYDVNNKETIIEFALKHEQIKTENIEYSFLIDDDIESFTAPLETLKNILNDFNKAKEVILNETDERFLNLETSNYIKKFDESNVFTRMFDNEYKNMKKELSKYSKKQLKHSDWLYLLKKHEAFLDKKNELEDFKNNNNKLLLLIKNFEDEKHINNIITQVNNIKPFIEYARSIEPNNPSCILEYMLNNVSFYNKVEEYFNLVYDIEKNFEIKVFDGVEDLDSFEKIVNNLVEQFSHIDSILVFKQDYLNLPEEIKGLILEYFRKLPEYSIKNIFLKSYYTQLLDKLLDNNILQSPKMEVDKFREQDFEVRDIQRFKVMDSIEQDQPTHNYRSSGLNEVSILKREYEKKRKLKPIRDLLNEISNLIFTLKPCFMMSPLSVSQYIDPKKINFDVVIFDEASQIMPEDAVPSLLRSKQAIVVGDTQQLPPTSFFMSREDDEVEDDLDDLESFLSECSTRFRNKSLLWHYRSKNEHLIAYSNKYFYQNRLITFPNAKESDDAGVEFKHVKDGVYDRGKSRKNREEAKEVIKSYKKINKNNPTKSIGIIAFSMAQENAIREEFIAANIDLNSTIDSQGEDLFVKNLETVQGDERDIIIMSIGYGRDSSGILSYNFGPINKDGGYKRLNVAITRSRFKTIVVSSIDPNELDDSKLNSEGSKNLKAYLRFAKENKLSAVTDLSRDLEFDSSFEESVFDSLKKEGFDIVPQVGCSGYRIDLGIKDPINKGDYILGIECDGAQYHSSQFARDRDKIRQSVLESLGWNIHRIWSDDWLNNRDYEIEYIKQKITSLTKGNNIMNHNNSFKTFSKVETVKDFEESTLKDKYAKYKEVELPLSKADNFFEIYTETIKKRIISVLEIESPVEREYLYKKIIHSFGIQKLGNQIESYCDELIYALTIREGIHQDDETISIRFIKDYYTPRISTEEQRPFRLIPKEEIAGAIYDILNNTFSATKDTLVSDVAKEIYHNNRIGDKIRTKIEEALEHLISKKIIKKEEDKYKLDKSQDELFKLFN